MMKPLEVGLQLGTGEASGNVEFVPLFVDSAGVLHVRRHGCEFETLQAFCD